VFENFWGNVQVASALERMIASDRIPQTILLAGSEGVGKATLARRFAARLLGGAEQIERDDLCLEQHRELIAEREKWPSEKRAEDPLLFASHPDFVTFCPEGPLRQISIQQMRLVKERSQLRPLKGQWRVFLIDNLDRANPQATDSLLKTLEEPPPHLVLISTAQNSFDLPATIRSRSVTFHLSPLSEVEMNGFAKARGIAPGDRRLALSGGSPGWALTMDLAAFEKRRGVMLALLESGAGSASFAAWVKASEQFLASKSEKLDLYFKPLYSLLEDLLVLRAGGTRIRNSDVAPRLQAVARKVSFEWVRQAVESADELVNLQRRNVQKGPSVDDLVLGLRKSAV
jgi:DNA polymerase III subunit delta'